jgi:hypothetical protein
VRQQTDIVEFHWLPMNSAPIDTDGFSLFICGYVAQIRQWATQTNAARFAFAATPLGE